MLVSCKGWYHRILEKNKMNKKSLKASIFLVVCRESAILKAIICKKIKTTLKRAWFPNHGDRDRIRTCDRLLRRQMLYPAELRDPLI